MADPVPTAEALFDLYRVMSGDEPDCYWKAMLVVATASPKTWQTFQPFLDLERQELAVEALEQLTPALSRGEALMLGLGLNLFRGHGSVDMAALAQELDAENWKAALRALSVFRSGFSGEG